MSQFYFTQRRYPDSYRDAKPPRFFCILAFPCPPQTGFVSLRENQFQTDTLTNNDIILHSLTLVHAENFTAWPGNAALSYPKAGSLCRGGQKKRDQGLSSQYWSA